MPIDIGEVLICIRKMLGRFSTTKTALEQLKEVEQQDPFKVLIATILSQRTKDEITVQAAQRLFSVYKNVKEFSHADVDKIEKLIKPVGFYRIKAHRIKEVATILMKKFHGKVPSTMEELLSLPSVGRKTANAVLAFGFRKPAIIVDTHAHRISNRIGIVKTRTPAETEAELRRIVNKRYWTDLNEVLVPFGKIVCKPINPNCHLCFLKVTCKYFSARMAGS